MAARLTTYVVVAIVAATFIAGLIVGAQRDDSDGPVDLIVHNAVVFTGDADARRPQCSGRVLRRRTSYRSCDALTSGFAIGPMTEYAPTKPFKVSVNSLARVS